MGIRVVIDDTGVTQTSGASSVTISSPLTVNAGLSAVPTVVSMSIGNNAVGSPGFYFLPSNATGTLPDPSSQPGATYVFTQPIGDLGIFNGGFLTGTGGCSLGTSLSQKALFWMSGTAGTLGSNSVVRANGVTLGRMSSLSITSDSKYWCVSVLSGTVSGSLFPANG